MNSNSDKPQRQDVLIRDNLVSTAVYFLQNPKVAQNPLNHKRLFLLKKGLSNEEIDLAIERASNLASAPTPTSTPTPSSSVVQIPQNYALPAPMPPQYFIPNPSIWARTTNLAASLAIISGFVYSAYTVYKKYIEPKLFGEEQVKKHPLIIIQEQLDQLTEAIKSLENNMAKIELNIKKQIEYEVAQYKPQQDVSLVELKNELASIKALMLNRKQFAPTPTIPSWQLEGEKQNKNELNDGAINGQTVVMNGDDHDLNGINDIKSHLKTSENEIDAED